jgi:hypothetical protein
MECATMLEIQAFQEQADSYGVNYRRRLWGERRNFSGLSDDCHNNLDKKTKLFVPH